MQITVLLADDHMVVREGLNALLSLDPELAVIGEASNGLQALEMALELHPNVVVLDIAMPQLNGLEAARRILQQVIPQPKVLILSAHGDDAYIQQTASMGVVGYLVKQTSAHILGKAIKEVYKGKTYYSPSISKRFRDQQNLAALSPGKHRKEATTITSREREVLQLIAEGRSNKEAASDLGISVKTVEKHRQSVMNKLDLHDTSGLTRYAISTGIIECSIQTTIL